MTEERIKIGRAIAMGETGGAKPDSSLVALVAAIRDMSLAAAKGRSYEWPESALIALADVDSALERGAQAASALRVAKSDNATLAAILRAGDADIPQSVAPSPGERVTSEGDAIRSNAAWRAMTVAAVAARDEWHAKAAAATEGEHKANQRANEMESRYRAESLRCNELAAERDALRERNDNQAATIKAYEDRHAAAMKAAESSESELAEAREALADWRGKALAYQEQRDSHARRADRWQRVAEAAEADANRIARQRNAELAAHNELAAFVGELAPVLAALPLAVLASDATEGGKLAKLYLRAELLASETTGERAARYRKESAND